MLGIEKNPSQTNNSLKMLSEDFYDNDFLLNDFNTAYNSLP